MYGLSISWYNFTNATKFQQKTTEKWCYATGRKF